jgi:hypothetical protein
MQVPLVGTNLRHFGELLECFRICKIDELPFLRWTILMFALRDLLKFALYFPPRPHEFVLEFDPNDSRGGHLAHEFFIAIVLGVLVEVGSLNIDLFARVVEAVCRSVGKLG